jgi:hypothetical protein
MIAIYKPPPPAQVCFEQLCYDRGTLTHVAFNRRRWRMVIVKALTAFVRREICRQCAWSIIKTAWEERL